MRCELNDCIHYTDDGICSIGELYKVYRYDEAPNIDLKDADIVWWNERYIAIKQQVSVV